MLGYLSVSLLFVSADVSVSSRSNLFAFLFQPTGCWCQEKLPLLWYCSSLLSYLDWEDSPGQRNTRNAETFSLLPLWKENKTFFFDFDLAYIIYILLRQIRIKIPFWKKKKKWNSGRKKGHRSVVIAPLRESAVLEGRPTFHSDLE